MKKTCILFFAVASLTVSAQDNNVGINTDMPTAKLHVNGNMRVQTVKDIDYSVIEDGFSKQNRYKALYWDPETKEIFTKVLDQPYVKSQVLYTDNENAEKSATNIPLNPNDYFLFLTDVSVKNSPLKPYNNYSVGVKSVKGKGNLMPVPGFELKPEGNSYKFKAYYKHPNGGKLYYYNLATKKISSPNQKDSPIWKGAIFAVSKKYVEPLYDITVNYNSYYKKNSGGRYGIELGKIIEENKGATSTITKIVDAKRNTEVK